MFATPGPEADPLIYVVDDDPDMRRAIRDLLQSVRLRVRSCETGGAFLEQVQTDQLGCAVLDLRLPDVGALEIIQTLKARGVELPVVVISGYGDIPTAVEAVKLGAVDFLEKPIAPQTLLRIVQRSLDINRIRLHTNQERAETERRLARLSEREREVLGHLVNGWSNKRISLTLSVSEKTVATHRRNLLAKMGTDNLIELMWKVTRTNLASDQTELRSVVMTG